MAYSLEKSIEKDTDAEVRQQRDQQLPRDFPDIVPPPADHLVDLQTQIVPRVVQVDDHHSGQQPRAQRRTPFIARDKRNPITVQPYLADRPASYHPRARTRVLVIARRPKMRLCHLASGRLERPPFYILNDNVENEKELSRHSEKEIMEIEWLKRYIYNMYDFD